MLGKLKSVAKALKEHDYTLFQSNGLILKQGEEFAHYFNVGDRRKWPFWRGSCYGEVVVQGVLKEYNIVLGSFLLYPIMIIQS